MKFLFPFIVRLFADDCVCYRVINSKEDCKKLQKDIDTLGAWAEKWGMRFQPVKCNMMTLSRKRSRIEYNYKLKGEDLVFLDSIKYLGATITNNLHWGKHIDEICAKAYRILGMLKRNLSACPQAVKLQAYKGLVRPVLEYAGAAWDPHQVSLQDKIEAVQKSAARFITSNYCHDPGSMTKIMQDLELEPLKERRKQSRLILFCKGINNEATIPSDLLITPARKTKNMHDQPFRQISTNCDTYKFSFIPNTIKDWNSIPSATISHIQAAANPVKSFAAIVRGGKI